MKDIGKNIKSIRISKSMTQDDLAEMLFVTRQTVSNYENGRSRPDIDTVIKLAEVLDTDTNAILYGPPISQHKTEERKKLIISVALSIVLSLIYILFRILFSDRNNFDYIMLRHLINMTLRPAIIFLLGWIIFGIIGLFSNWQVSGSRWIKRTKHILWVILGLLVITLIPHIIFTVTGMIHMSLYTCTSMSMTHIPVYTNVASFIIELTAKFPFVYSLLGAILKIVTIKNYK